MKALFFLGKLGTGGAERQYVQLAIALTERGHEITFVTVYPGGQHWELAGKHPTLQLESLFQEKESYPLRALVHFLGTVWKLRSKSANCDVLYSGLHLPNLMAKLATVGRSAPKLVWGIRASDMTLNRRRAIPRMLCARLSHGVDLLISNSYAGLEYHQQLGYRTPKVEVLPNGIDTVRYQFDAAARSLVRAEFGIDEAETLIGVVGRLDPMKGHDTFLSAFARLIQSKPQSRALIVGGGREEAKKRLELHCAKLGIEDRVSFAGERSDLPALYSAFDVFCLSSSYGEGFPNVVGEAMACELPAVVTDVGDAARVLDDPAFVVPPRDSEALSLALEKVIATSDGRVPKNRDRVKEHFAIASLVEASEKALQSVIA